MTDLTATLQEVLYQLAITVDLWARGAVMLLAALIVAIFLYIASQRT